MSLSLKSVQTSGKPETMQYYILWQGMYVWKASTSGRFVLNIARAERSKVSTSN
jgi:hypothetical protein